MFVETGHFVNEDGVNSTELAMLKRNFKDHVTVPKKPRGMYATFIKEEFAAKKKVIVSSGVTGMQIAQAVVKALSEDWNKVSDKKKALYQRHAVAD